MKQKHHPEGKYVSLAIFFVLAVFLLIVSSFVWKAVTLIQASKFDGAHQFILGSLAKNGQAQIAVFSPQDKTVTLFAVSGKLSDGDMLPIPLDAQEAVTWESAENSPVDNIHAMLFPSKPYKTPLTIIDAYKLWWLTTSASVSSYTLHADSIAEEIKKNYSKDVIDQDLYQEAKSIALVNATGKPGFGNNMSQVLSTIGGNVVSVGGGEDTKEHTQILYSGDRTYTLSRLERIFNVSGVVSTNPSPLADITVIIGKDFVKN